MRIKIVPTALLACAVAACSSPESQQQPPAEPVETEAPTQAVAMLMTADGIEVGRATAMPDGDSVAIALDVEGMMPGEHGVHVHETGSCVGPDFASAGGHWNPAGAAHGLEDPEGQHAGDMPNLTVAEDGTGTLGYTLVGASFDGLMDADGSAFVIHADRDDQVTDPSGNSGDRIACGIFAAG